MSNSLSTLINTDSSPTSSNILSLETLQQQYNNALVSYQQAYQSLVNASQSTNDQANYIGCYNDTGTTKYRAMSQLNSNGTLSTINGNDYNVTYDQAYQYAINNNYKYFSTQVCNSSGGCQAGFSNDLAQATQYGVANNCVNNQGGSWTNAIYSITSNNTSINDAMQNVQYWGNELISINQQIMDLLQNESPNYQDEINNRQSQNSQLSTNLQSLLQEREKVNDRINMYNSSEQKITETGIVTKQNYFQYILYVVILVVVIIYFFKIVLFPNAQRGGGNGSSTTKMKDLLFLLGLMLLFLLSGFFFKQHAGFILIILVIVIFALIRMKLLPNVLRF